MSVFLWDRKVHCVGPKGSLIGTERFIVACECPSTTTPKLCRPIEATCCSTTSEVCIGMDAKALAEAVCEKGRDGLPETLRTQFAPPVDTKVIS